MFLNLQDFIEIIPVGIIIFDKDLKITHFNKIAAKLFSNIEVNFELNKLEVFKDKTLKDKITFSIENLNFKSIVYYKQKNDILPLLLHFSIINNTELYGIILTNEISCFTDNNFSVISEIEGETQVGFYNIIGKDKKMKELYKQIEFAAESDSNVLIYGESGTGKELVARAIHELSRRKDYPFVAVNCSALSETILESELFGHVKGAFTGAYKDKVGKFEAAHRGTIFLDEIGDISPLIQLKLLRVIQEKTVTRVGDNKEIKVDMRIICATNKDLRELVNKGLFREDLFYRLKVFSIYTIPLREHKNDIPLLVDYFIKKFNRKTGKKIIGVSEETLRALMDYCWPGNVRELENAIEYSFVVCTKDIIEIFDLPQEIRSVSLKQAICKSVDEKDKLFISFLEKNEQNFRKNITKEELLDLLKSTNYNKSQVARKLGISRVALWKKLKKFNIL